MFHIPGGVFHGLEGQPRGMTTMDRMAADARNQNIVNAIQSRNDVAAAWKARAEALEADRDRLLEINNQNVRDYNALAAFARSKGIIR